jgi:hypothetical protein
MIAASAADLKSPHHERQVRLRDFRSINGTRNVNLLVPMTFRSSHKGCVETDGELRKVGIRRVAKVMKIPLENTPGIAIPAAALT